MKLRVIIATALLLPSIALADLVMVDRHLIDRSLLSVHFRDAQLTSEERKKKRSGIVIQKRIQVRLDLGMASNIKANCSNTYEWENIEPALENIRKILVDTKKIRFLDLLTKSGLENCKYDRDSDNL